MKVYLNFVYLWSHLYGHLIKWTGATSRVVIFYGMEEKDGPKMESKLLVLSDTLMVSGIFLSLAGFLSHFWQSKNCKLGGLHPLWIFQTPSNIVCHQWLLKIQILQKHIMMVHSHQCWCTTMATHHIQHWNSLYHPIKNNQLFNFSIRSTLLCHWTLSFTEICLKFFFDNSSCGDIFHLVDCIGSWELHVTRIISAFLYRIKLASVPLLVLAADVVLIKFQLVSSKYSNINVMYFN